jgi:hypothetical protein
MRIIVRARVDRSKQRWHIADQIGDGHAARRAVHARERECHGGRRDRVRAADHHRMFAFEQRRESACFGVHPSLIDRRHGAPSKTQ